MYYIQCEMRLKSENAKKEADRLYRQHLVATERAYFKSLRKKRLKAELYLTFREHFEKILGIYEEKEKERKEKRKYRRIEHKV